MLKPVESLIMLGVIISLTMGVNFGMINSYMELKSLNYVSLLGCFHKAEQLNVSQMFKNNFHIEIVNIDKNKLEFTFPNEFHTGIILYSDCKQIENFLKKCAEKNFFGIRYHWLIISKSSKIISTIKNVPLTLNSDVKLMIPKYEEEYSHFIVIDVYNPAFYNGGKFRQKIIGYYTNSIGFRLNESGLKYTERRDMSDVKLRASITLPVDFFLPLSEYLIYDGQREINTFNRFHCKLIFFCQDYYNFSFTGIEVTKSWGYLLPNNSFDGLVGQLERNETDISLSCLFFRSDRLEKIDYGARTWIMKVAFIFRNPKVPASITVFLQPLSFSIWITTLIIFMLAILLYKFISISEEKYSELRESATWSELIVFIFGTFCQQGTTLNSSFICGRIVILFSFVLSLLVYQFYSASIVSILLMKPPTPIKTPEDLLNSPMECRSENVLYNEDYFNRTKDATALNIFRNKLRGSEGYDYFLNPEEGLNLVSQGGYAFNVELATAYPIIEKTFQEDIICELKEVQLMRALQMFSSFQKGSSFKKTISVRLQRFAEVGILDREKKHWVPRKPVCLDKLSASKFTVGLIDMYPAFVMLFIGLVTTYVIYLLEVSWKKYFSNGITRRREFPFTN